MRFSAPRSISPSPVRGKTSTFGLQSDSDSNSDEYDLEESSSSGSNYDSDSGTSTSESESLSYPLNSCFLQPRRPRHSAQSIVERRQIDDTIAAIRLRTRHHDPYEEWEKATRKDAFRTARKEQSATQLQLTERQEKQRNQDAERLAAIHSQQMAEVQNRLETMKIQQQREETRMREGWKMRDQKLWERIETVIQLEEDKVRKRIEAENKAKEEEEKQRKQEELKRRLVEEKKKQEEEQKRVAEEEERQKKEQEDRKEKEELLKREEEKKLKSDRVKAEDGQRKTLGLTTAEEDWRQARINLQRLKMDAMTLVKSNKELKAEWGKWRRQITPKIGQLTNDQQAIKHISTQIIHILVPPNSPAHHRAIYTALLSSLAKAILLQAETEVIAEKRSAQPLGQVTFILLDSLDGFSEIFFAKLVQRTGGWPIPVVVPNTDTGGQPWKDTADRTKAIGYRKSATGDDLETAAEYGARVSAIMRVYFHILKVPPSRQPLKPMFQLPRYWTWFARLMGERGLLETAVAPQLIFAALDVMGADAIKIWGHQWIKILALIYEGITTGLGNQKLIGGESSEGTAARARIQMEVERIINAS
ncbi:GLE1-like protein-domain-containing protein [Infundibulicybe gibba]|nr:GLE1-like protein-domain-containing protein [Infundibulicybe gibba]